MERKLAVGDICRLNEIIPGVRESDSWKTGLYRVTRIDVPVQYGRYNDDPRTHSYRFEKIKKDGTAYKGFFNGYRCTAWDKKIAEEIVTII